MPKTFATAFELGDRAFGRARDAFAVFGQVAITRRNVHHFQHVLGVRFPVGGHVQHTTDLQLAAHQLSERRLNDTTLVVAALVPWVREKQHQAIEAVVGHTEVEHFDRIAIVDPQVGQALSQHAIEQRANTRTVHFHADEILLRRGRGHFQQRMAHAETDFQRARCRTTEHLIEVHRRIGQRQHEQRRALLQTFLLAFGHAPGAHHETLDAAVLALFAFFRLDRRFV